MAAGSVGNCVGADAGGSHQGLAEQVVLIQSIKTQIEKDVPQSASSSNWGKLLAMCEKDMEILSANYDQCTDIDLREPSAGTLEEAAINDQKMSKTKLQE